MGEADKSRVGEEVADGSRDGVEVELAVKVGSTVGASVSVGRGAIVKGMNVAIGVSVKGVRKYAGVNKDEAGIP